MVRLTVLSLVLSALADLERAKPGPFCIQPGMNETDIPHMTAFQIKAVENANVNKPNGRGERIRTSDSCVPNAVLYQAELHPEKPILILAVPGAIHVRHVGCNCTQEGVLEQSKLAR